MNTRLQNTLNAIDEINAQDPNQENLAWTSAPKELLYGQRMTQALKSFGQQSELLQIAARGQHLKRWAIPRQDYPMDRPGYLKWRTQLKIMHGELVGGIMRQNGYTEVEIKYVKDLLMKKDLKKNVESQTLEDAACLVFLEYHIADFAEGKSEEKLIDIIQKTWSKMSEKGHELALKLEYPAPVLALIQKALAS